jgi:hypothetical protein
MSGPLDYHSPARPKGFAPSGSAIAAAIAFACAPAAIGALVLLSLTLPVPRNQTMLFSMLGGAMLVALVGVTIAVTAAVTGRRRRQVLLLPRTAEAAIPAPQTSSPAVLKLQQEQIHALEEAADVAKQLFQRGLGPGEDVNRLNRKPMETRLRMATSAKERADALSDALAAAKEQDEFLAKAFKAGLANDVTVQEAKAYRLNIEEMICVEEGK